MIKKIYLIRSSKTKYGGAENYLNRLSKALEREKIEYKIINSLFPSFLPSWLRVILFNFQLSLTKNDKFYYSLDRITCPDVYRAGDGVHKSFLRIEQKSKFNLLHPTYIYLEERCFRKAKSIITNSIMVKKEIIDIYNILPKKIKVIYNGIENKEPDYQKSFKKLSDEFSIQKNQSIIIFVGSGFKRKGAEEFLQILAELKTTNLKAFVIGKEKNINFYQNLARSLNIDNRVIFTGPRIDVDDFYTISDILLFPTHYDPFSNVVLEAMNFGNAVFTTRNNGASEILDSSFIMSHPKDKRVISLIDNLLGDKNSLLIEKEKNKKISKDFSIERNLKETLEVLKDIEK